MKANDIVILGLSKYIRPKVEESYAKDWVLYGRKNSFYNYIIDRFKGSITNSSIIRSYQDLIYGRGLGYEGETEEGLKALKEIISDKDLKRIVDDFQLFNEASMQVIQSRGGDLSSISHIRKNLVVPNKVNEKNEIYAYWFCKDWSNLYSNTPKRFSAFSEKKEAIQIYNIKPYGYGNEYFEDPEYIAGMPYAEQEEEIANLYINSIKNGLSAGYIINIPNGNTYTTEEKDDLEKKIKQRLVGSSNSSDFILSFNGSEVEIKVTPFPINDKIHKQWEFLTEEAKRQLLTAHRATSPSLVGLVSSSGFSNTADEMDMAEEQLIKRVIRPKQNHILKALEEVLLKYGKEYKGLYFKPLTEKKEEENSADNKEKKIKEDEVVIEKEEEKTELSKQCSSNVDLELLLSKGEDLDLENWDLVEEKDCTEITLREDVLNNLIQLANTPKGDARKKSKQDTSLFKIRYQYAGNKNPEREFCQKMIKSNKIFRAEDLENAKGVNKGFGVNGSDDYNIFLYKGGVNCKHWFKRVILLKKNNKKVSVNNARKMILQLDPKDRPDAKWGKNPKEVSQIAGEENNYWKVN